MQSDKHVHMKFHEVLLDYCIFPMVSSLTVKSYEISISVLGESAFSLAVATYGFYEIALLNYAFHWLNPDLSLCNHQVEP